jgi:hypothetical protein
MEEGVKSHGKKLMLSTEQARVVKGWFGVENFAIIEQWLYAKKVLPKPGSFL